MAFDVLLRRKLDQKLERKQAKKDERFAVPVRVARELSREELRELRDRAYLEANFCESDYEKKIIAGGSIVRVEDL